ncbi:hypothetical protein pdam_00010691 [Pocillopora damicornis]|uniref:Band 7 domain-containing protein n=1 Tax=Pocillopora damicornis TaxID=46731 RepID=A0A3M6T778_POCDA|nr:hypothetical protein pdam_00010691 [Pocillopora damicornis]
MTARSTSTSMHVNPAAQNYERAVSGGDKRGLLEEGTRKVVSYSFMELNRKENAGFSEPGGSGDEHGSSEERGFCDYLLTFFSSLIFICTLPLSLCFCIKIVQEYERAVIFRLGRLLPGGAKGPGMFFILPCIDSYQKVDLRVVSFDVPPQEVLTKDSVTVAVDAVVYFRIYNATMSITNVENANRSTRLLAQTTLRNVLGTKNLSEILGERESISETMQASMSYTSLDEATDPWGVKVERVEVKDVRLPQQLQRAMAAEAEASREARAKVIAAEGEQNASRALKEAADIISESPSALQLRYLQTLTTISAEKNSTDSGDRGCCDYLLTGLSIILFVCTLPLSLFFCLKIVQEYERAVIFRLGRLLPGGAKGPGLFFILPCIDSYQKVDLRTVSFDVPPQEILTKDSVTVAVDAVVYFRIHDATMSITNVENSNRSTRLLAQTTLRNVLGTKNLSEILADREVISHVMQSSLDEATDPWGVKVERVEVKDVRLPQQLQRAMAAEAEASREARAKVIAAEGEQNASRALKEAADIISESPSALQLRYLQTLTTISAEKNSTILFPLPVDFMSRFLPDKKDDDVSRGFCDYVLTVLSFLIFICTLPFSLCFTLKIVQEYERAVMFRLGRLLPGGAKGPGLFFILPCIDSYQKVDLRTVSFDVPPQEILTKDSVTVAVDAVVYFRISDPTMSVTNVEKADQSTRLLAQTTLRNFLGTKNLSEILADREEISHAMQTSLDSATDPWGVKVERVEVKDVRLPQQLQRAMAAEAEATRDARAKVIAAEGEQNASRALKEAADIISESPSALQLRYLQTLTSISAEKNSTIIFPLPVDFLSRFLPDEKK